MPRSLLIVPICLCFASVASAESEDIAGLAEQNYSKIFRRWLDGRLDDYGLNIKKPNGLEYIRRTQFNGQRIEVRIAGPMIRKRTPGFVIEVRF